MIEKIFQFLNTNILVPTDSCNLGSGEQAFPSEPKTLEQEIVMHIGMILLNLLNSHYSVQRKFTKKIDSNLKKIVKVPSQPTLSWYEDTISTFLGFQGLALEKKETTKEALILFVEIFLSMKNLHPLLSTIDENFHHELTLNLAKRDKLLRICQTDLGLDIEKNETFQKVFWLVHTESSLFDLISVIKDGFEKTNCFLTLFNVSKYKNNITSLDKFYQQNFNPEQSDKKVGLKQKIVFERLLDIFCSKMVLFFKPFLELLVENFPTFGENFDRCWTIQREIDRYQQNNYCRIFILSRAPLFTDFETFPSLKTPFEGLFFRAYNTIKKTFPNYRIVFPYNNSEQNQIIGVKIIQIITTSDLLGDCKGICINRLTKLDRNHFDSVLPKSQMPSNNFEITLTNPDAPDANPNPKPTLSLPMPPKTPPKGAIILKKRPESLDFTLHPSSLKRDSLKNSRLFNPQSPRPQPRHPQDLHNSHHRYKPIIPF